MIFENRIKAGEQLAAKLLQQFPDLKNNASVIVLALPRGGVPVGFKIGKKLQVRFDLIITHKLGAPGNEEFAIGAVAEDGSSFIEKNAASWVSRDYIKQEIRHQLEEIQERVKKYRGGRDLPLLEGKIVILVDDGVATGNTMKAAIKLCLSARAQKVIIAVPVVPRDTLKSLQREALVVFLATPFPFFAIGKFYHHFEQLSDEEVKSYLAVAKR